MKKFIANNFGLALLIFVILGLSFPNLFKILFGYEHILLGFGLFIGFLKINFDEIFHLKKNWGKMLILVFLYLLIVPIFFFFIFQKLPVDTQIAIFLLTGVSSAMVNPALTNILNLKTLWTTVFVILTSFLLPFTLPFLTKFLFSISVDINEKQMLIFLSMMIFIPTIASYIIQKLSHKTTTLLKTNSGFLGVISMALFTGIVFAKNADFLRENIFQIKTLNDSLIVLLAFTLLFLFGYLLPNFDLKTKLTNSLMWGTMNSGVSILIASNFFNEKVLLVVFLSEFAFIITQATFPYIVKYKLKNIKE